MEHLDEEEEEEEQEQVQASTSPILSKLDKRLLKSYPPRPLAPQLSPNLLEKGQNSVGTAFLQVPLSTPRRRHSWFSG